MRPGRGVPLTSTAKSMAQLRCSIEQVDGVASGTAVMPHRGVAEVGEHDLGDVPGDAWERARALRSGERAERLRPRAME